MSANNNAEWIEWRGGECPLKQSEMVMVRVRGGFEAPPFSASALRWSRDGTPDDIVAYKVDKAASKPIPDEWSRAYADAYPDRVRDYVRDKMGFGK